MSLLKRIWSRTNYRIAFIVAVLLLAWLFTGILSSSDQQEASSESTPITQSVTAENKSLTVEATYLDAQAYKANLKISGRTTANRSVNVKAELEGQIINTPAIKGSIVKKGDILCELAAEDRLSRLAEAEAAVATAQLEYDGALRLKTGGFQSKTAIARSKSDLETAKANLVRNRLNVERLKIRAPFAGVVDDRTVEVGDYIRQAETCATVLELNPLLVAAQVSATEVGKLNLGDSANVLLMTGQKVTGIIRYIGRDADELTRTFPIEVAVPNSDYQLISGISAQLQLFFSEIDAHLISPSLLALDDAGKLGLRILDNDYKVQFVNINLVGDDEKGVWVSGLPKRTLLITVGQEYVTAGQTVNAVIIDETANSISELNNAL